MRFLSASKHYIVVIILLTIFCAQSFRSINDKSATFDEVQYFGIGKYLLLNQKWDIMGSIMHPPLSYYISSIPLFTFQENKQVWEYGDKKKDLMFLGAVDALRGQELLSDPHNNNDKILIASRFMILLTGLLLGLYVYRFSSSLYGVSGGIISLFLFTFCPNMLAFSGIAVPDMPLTAFFFIAIYYFRIFLKKQSNVSGINAGLALGLSLSTKFTALILLPIELILYIVYLFKEKKRLNAGIFIVMMTAFIVVYTMYGFDYLPFIQGLEYRQIQLQAGFKTFFHGRYSTGGWWYYYPAVLLFKTPIPVMLLLVVAFAHYVKYRKTDWFDALMLYLPVIVIFTVFATSNIAAGVRYLLPLYPFVFVVIGGIPLQRNILKVVMCIMAAWYVYGSLKIAPDYLSYFNEITGGPENGYKYLVDSNLDWGQDLKGLKKYMDSHKIQRISLSYFGIDSPQRYGIEYDWLPSHHLYNPDPLAPVNLLKNRWLAISATNLQGVYLDSKDEFKWLQDQNPVAKIGYSIFIYDLNKVKSNKQ